MRALISRIRNGVRAHPWLLIAAIGLEVSYIVGRGFVVAGNTDPFARELKWTVWRLIFVVLYAAFFIDWRRSSESHVNRQGLPLIAVAVTVYLVTMPLAGYGVAMPLAVLYAITSPVVAMREEFFYRAILQSALVKLLGPVGGILLATVCFVLYHIGAQPMDLVTISSLAAAGFILGVVFWRTGNIWIAVAIHTVADIVGALSPQRIFVAPSIAVVANVSAALLAIAWARSRDRHD